MKSAATPEHLKHLAEAAFLPLETEASLEAHGHYQIRILGGPRAVHIEEMPALEVRDESDLRGWLGRMRRRLEEKGFALKPWEGAVAMG